VTNQKRKEVRKMQGGVCGKVCVGGGGEVGQTMRVVGGTRCGAKLNHRPQDITEMGSQNVIWVVLGGRRCVGHCDADTSSLPRISRAHDTIMTIHVRDELFQTTPCPKESTPECRAMS